MRRLEITIIGRWFIALTLGIGMVAMFSGNNIIYLIESLLLAGLILSGVLSEQTVSSIDFSVRRMHATALAPTHDLFTIKNETSRTLFCIEFGHWSKGKFTPEGFVARLAPYSSVTCASDRVFKERGLSPYDGIAVATCYPFNFFRKICVYRKAGTRLVWPCREANQAMRLKAQTRAGARLQGAEWNEGEIRAYSDGDDSRRILWNKSLSKFALANSTAGSNDWVVRSTRSESPAFRAILDLRSVKDQEELERKITDVAQVFHEGEGSLTLFTPKGREEIKGRIPCLDRLAQIERAS